MTCCSDLKSLQTICGVTAMTCKFEEEATWGRLFSSSGAATPCVLVPPASTQPDIALTSEKASVYSVTSGPTGRDRDSLAFFPFPMHRGHPCSSAAGVNVLLLFRDLWLLRKMTSSHLSTNPSLFSAHPPSFAVSVVAGIISSLSETVFRIP